MENTGFELNGSVYKVYHFMIGKTKWMVLVVTGYFNYVNVTKKTHLRSMGIAFKNFDKAVSHYKNPSIKLELTKIELNIS